MATCSSCKKPGRTVSSDRMTDWDRATMMHGVRGGHPAALIFTGLSVVAKELFTTVYECENGHLWREWFD